MIYLIADFRADGKDKHQSFVAEGTTDRERAVDSVAEILRSQGAIVTQITVCPDAESMTAVVGHHAAPRLAYALRRRELRSRRARAFF